jgi:hypothetical protein
VQVGTPRIDTPVPARNLMRDGRLQSDGAPRRRATLFHRGLAIPAPVLAVSPTGASVAAAVELAPGQDVVVGFDGGVPVFAIVVACEDGRIDLRFRS